MPADCVPELVDGAVGGFAECGLGLGAGFLDRIEVWAVGRQVDQARAGGPHIPVQEDTVNLSEVLLDEGYYDALQAAKRKVDGVTVIDETLLVPFKARAFLDLVARA